MRSSGTSHRHESNTATGKFSEGRAKIPQIEFKVAIPRGLRNDCS